MRLLRAGQRGTRPLNCGVRRHGKTIGEYLDVDDSFGGGGDVGGE